MPPASAINNSVKEKRTTTLKTNGVQAVNAPGSGGGGNDSPPPPPPPSSVKSNGNGNGSAAKLANSSNVSGSNADLSASGKTTRSNGNGNGNGNSAADLCNPMKQALVCIEHKIRNLEKRKTKLETYKAIQASGKDLSSDQKSAVAKYDSVIANLEFAKEFSKSMQQFSRDAEKEQKKQARKEAIARTLAETNKIREVLIIQNILTCFNDASVRGDFLSGANGALVVSEEEMAAVEKFCNDTRLRRPEAADDAPLVLSAHKVAELFSLTIDARPKQFHDVTFEKLRGIFQAIEDCGYLDKIFIASSEQSTSDDQQNGPELADEPIQSENGVACQSELAPESTPAEVVNVVSEQLNDVQSPVEIAAAAPKDQASISEEHSIPYNDQLSENSAQQHEFQTQPPQQQSQPPVRAAAASPALYIQAQHQFNAVPAANENVGLQVFFTAGAVPPPSHAPPTHALPPSVAPSGVHRPINEQPIGVQLQQQQQPQTREVGAVYTQTFEQYARPPVPAPAPIHRLADVIGEGTFQFLQESEIDPAELGIPPAPVVEQPPVQHHQGSSIQQHVQPAEELQQAHTISSQTFTNQSFPNIHQQSQHPQQQQPPLRQQQQIQAQIINSGVQAPLFQQQLQQPQPPHPQAQRPPIFSPINAVLAHQAVPIAPQDRSAQLQASRSQPIPVIPIPVLPQFNAQYGIPTARSPEFFQEQFNKFNQLLNPKVKLPEMNVVRTPTAAETPVGALSRTNPWNSEMEFATGNANANSGVPQNNTNAETVINNANANNTNANRNDDQLNTGERTQGREPSAFDSNSVHGGSSDEHWPSEDGTNGGGRQSGAPEGRQIRGEKDTWVASEGTPNTNDGGQRTSNSRFQQRRTEDDVWPPEGNTNESARRSSGNFQQRRGNEDKRDDRDRERERERERRPVGGGASYRNRNYGGNRGGGSGGGGGGSGSGGNIVFFRNNDTAGTGGGNGGGGNSNYYHNNNSGSGSRYESSAGSGCGGGGGSGGGGGNGSYRGARGNQRSNHNSGNFGRSLPRNSNANAGGGGGNGGSSGGAGSSAAPYMNARQSSNR